jgi:hypothetical protein
MSLRRSARRSAPRVRSWGPSIESLERRDCPAVIAVTGSREVAETVGTTTLTVTLSAATPTPVAVDYFLQGSATAGRDYRLAIGTRSMATPTGTITFQPGETTKQISVAVVNDADREGNESMVLSLFKPRNATLGNAKSATITIRDDDNYTASIVGAAQVAEGQAREYQLRLSSPATKSETFYINSNTTSGSATPGTDYRPITQLPLIFKPGETVKTFRVQTLNDNNAAEYDEYFFLRATPSTPGFPTVPAGSVTIPGPLGPAPLPGLSISDASVTEGNSGTVSASFTITLAATYGLPVTVTYATADGTATSADGDYQPVSRSVTIAPGETSAVVTVNVVGDRKVENDETFSIVLSTPVNATLVKATGVATIVNDDTDAANSFQVTLKFADPSIPAVQKDVFQRAVNRLQQVIVGDVPDVTVGGRVIDDIEITAFVETMDPGLNGYAFASAWRPGAGGLPYSGEIHINASRILNPGIYHTIIHEMLHSLGFYSTFFRDAGKISGLGTANPLFTGTNAIREYATYFGLTNPPGVPLYEDVAAQGSYASHWSTRTVGTEIMSVGWDTTRTDLRPFSRMTAGVLQDLGYRVNYAAADAYVRPDVARAAGTVVTPRSVVGSADVAFPFSAYAGAVESLARTPEPQAKQRAFAALGRG